MSVEGTIGGNRPAEVAAGLEFAGYRVERTLGRGGMGVVYLARDLDLDRAVALKVIRSDLADDPTFRARFRSESRTAAAIDHPHVVTVFGAGELDGLLYVAMRYVPGPDLGRIVSRDGPLSPETAAELLGQVAGGLDAVHAAGLVHRDVKPGNVIVARDSAGTAAYLADFGLAKAIASTTGLTATGELIGTVDYIAPEQIEGRRVDARTDVYALGCVLFHAVTGGVPFPQPESSAKMWAHLNESAPAPEGRAAALDPVIRRAMAKDPADRFPSAGDLGRAAVAAVRHEAVTEPERAVGAGDAAPAETARLDTEPTPVRTREVPAAPPRRRRRRILAAGAVGLIAALGAAAAIEVPRLSDGGGNPPAKPAGIEVPSLAGEPLNLAQRRLEELGLRSSEVGGGLFGVLIPSEWDVCETSPPAGTDVRRGSTVELLVDRPDVC
jgi:Protein kinase domain/PASTA domain